jgi:hypothetical protein
MAPGTNKLEIQGNSSRQDRLHHVEDMSEFLESNASYSEPHLQNEQDFEYGSQVQRMDLDLPPFPDPATTDNSTPNVGYSYVPPTRATHAPESSGQANITSFLKEVNGIGTIANPEPWSLYMPNNMSHMSHEVNTNQEAYPNETSDTSPSTFEQNSEFSHLAADDQCTRISSYGMNDSTMNDSMLTEHLGPIDYLATYGPVPSSSSFGSSPMGPVFLLRHATPSDDRPYNHGYTSVSNIAV